MGAVREPDRFPVATRAADASHRLGCPLTNVVFRLSGLMSGRLISFHSLPLNCVFTRLTERDEQSRKHMIPHARHTPESQNALQRDRNNRCDCFPGGDRAELQVNDGFDGKQLSVYAVRFQAACSSTCWPPGVTLTLWLAVVGLRCRGHRSSLLLMKWTHINQS